MPAKGDLRKIKAALTVLLIISSGLICGQNAPVTTVGTATGNTVVPVTVPVTVTNFVNIGAMSLTLDYYYPSVHLVQAVPLSALSSFAYGESDLGNGYHRISMGWYGTGLTLPDGSVIVNLSFTYISGFSLLQWYDNGESCEYADAFSHVLNDVPTSTYYLNGAICGEIGLPGAISGPGNVCPGQTGAVYSVSPAINAANYYWTVPSGATIVSGNGSSAITVDYSSNAVSGSITVYGYNPCSNGLPGNTPVIVHSLPSLTLSGGDTACGAGSTVLTFALTGIPPWSFSYSAGSSVYSVSGQATSPYTTTVNDPGTYMPVSVVDAYCNGNTYGSALFVILPKPPVPAITLAGEQLISNAVSGNQWYLGNSAVPGEILQTFTPSVTGYYHDVVTLGNCSSDPSAEIYVVVDGVNPEELALMVVNQNPVKDVLRLRNPYDGAVKADLRVISPEGRPVVEKSGCIIGAKADMEIDISKCRPGLYFLMLRVQNKTVTRKLIVY